MDGFVMPHQLSFDDEQFLNDFEAFEIPAERFNHEAHVRLAYVYLCRGDKEDATNRMKQALLGYLAHLGVDPGKYHETITRAWIGAVSHFMDATTACGGFADFISRNSMLLDTKIMLSHYSAEVLFSNRARCEFVDPDVSPIPGLHD